MPKPTLKRIIPAVVAVVVHSILSAEPAHAWGLGTHVMLAYDVLRQVSILPSAAAGLLSKYAIDYLYGNIAADFVLAKRLSKVPQFCHQWVTGFQIFDSAPTDQGRAFGLGYLSHLAADTVAHNKYVPHQLTVTATTMEFGHAYWELRADLQVPGQYWRRLRRLLKQRFWDHEALLEQRLNAALLPFRVNRQLFRSINLVISHDSARTLSAMMERWSRFPLDRSLVESYRQECIDRTIDVITHGPNSSLMNEDPNGRLSLADTKKHRRHVRHLARLGEVTQPMIQQKAVERRPAPWPLTPLPETAAMLQAGGHWTENGKVVTADEKEPAGLMLPAGR